MRGTDLPAWPEWCYVPLHGAYAIVSGGGDERVPHHHAHHVGIVGALAAWRMTQGIYRFDPAVYDAVRDTPVTGDVPSAVLYQLPEWCVYMETPGLEWPDAAPRAIHGVWAHLDWDMRDGEDRPLHELRLVLDTARTPAEALDTSHGCLSVPLILGTGTVAEAIERVVSSGRQQAQALGLPVDAAQLDAVDPAHAATILAPVLSLLLYLCSQAAEITGRLGAPGNPAPKRTRRDGWRLFAADGPRAWDVGVRMGAALRRAYQAEQASGPTAEHVGPRPHIRRSHWHTFVSGARLRPNGTEVPLLQRRRELRWLPPIPVNLQDVDQLPAVVRRVR